MTVGSETVDRVIKGQLCTGCGLCASVSRGAISMRMEAPGYSRPQQMGIVTPDAERIIAAACPGAVVAEWQAAPETHAYWGPVRRVTTGHALDPEVRFEGSSGGAISALIIHALDTGLVDRAIHVAADPQNPTRNIMISSKTRAEVVAGAGSRYTASSPLEQIDAALAGGGSIAFVGKPCDVSALRRLGAVDPRVKRHVPVMLSFFCGGMPSHDGVDRILKTMGTRRDDIVAFRYRGQGWPGTTAATAADGRVYEMSYADSWGGHLSKEVQFRCKICPDAVGGVADIACADAWYGGESGYPQFDERDGRSLIVARSETGARLLNSACTQGVLEVEELEIGEIDLMQPSQARRKRLVLARSAALTATGQPKPKMRGTRVWEAAKAAGLGEAAHNFAGTVRRIVMGRR